MLNVVNSMFFSYQANNASMCIVFISFRVNDMMGVIVSKKLIGKFVFVLMMCFQKEVFFLKSINVHVYIVIKIILNKIS